MRVGRAGPRPTLLWVIERTLRLLHPFMPFVTEEVWQRLGKGGDSIVIASWPEEHPEHEDLGAEQSFATIRSLVEEIRTLEVLIQLRPGYQLVLDESVSELLRPMQPAIQRMTRASIEFSGEPRLAGRSLRISSAGVRGAIEV